MRQVCQSLWEISQHLPPAWIVLFGKQSQIVRRGGGLFECPQRLTAPPLARQAFRQPESTRQKDSLLALQSVDAPVARAAEWQSPIRA